MYEIPLCTDVNLRLLLVTLIKRYAKGLMFSFFVDVLVSKRYLAFKVFNKCYIINCSSIIVFQSFDLSRICSILQ
jgi:hypothetical protein